VRLGINGALAIRDVLLDSSETVLADQRRGELTQAFRDLSVCGSTVSPLCTAWAAATRV
jgi:hypothetical protein